MSGEKMQHRAPRFATDAAIVIRHGEDELRGRCMNLSRGGLCSELPAALKTGEAYPIELSLVFDADTESEPLALKARAVWCTQLGEVWQVGFQFQALDESEQKFLQMFLRYLQSS